MSRKKILLGPAETIEDLRRLVEEALNDIAGASASSDFTGPVSANNNRLTGLGKPAALDDAVPVRFLREALAGINAKINTLAKKIGKTVESLWRRTDVDHIETPYFVTLDDTTDSRAIGLDIQPTAHLAQASTPLLSAGGATIAYDGKTSVKSLGVNVTAPTADGDVTIPGVVTLSGLSAASRVLIASSSKTINISIVTDAELEFLSGVTSSVQDQLDDLAADLATLTTSHNNLSTYYSDHVHNETGTVTDGPHNP